MPSRTPQARSASSMRTRRRSPRSRAVPHCHCSPVSGRLPMSRDARYLHHVGYVVRDISHGLDVLRQLGFLMTPPAFVGLPSDDGAPAEPVGAGNSHATMPRNFVEVAT